jgi:FixJ family two-component response regulator
MTDARHTPSDRPPIGPSPRKSLIYVVDDDYDVLRSLRFLLETEGFDVRTFRSGSALLGSSTRQGADCLVVDYKMAGIDGLELAETLRGLDVSTPIILITGFPEKGMRERVLSTGAQGFLVKPFTQESLISTLSVALQA